jgi:hypothetical protein
MALRLKTQTPNLIEIDSDVSEMTHADKHAPPIQQTTHEICVNTGKCPSGTLLMLIVKCIVGLQQQQCG